MADTLLEIKDLKKYFLTLDNVQIEENASREMPLYFLLKHVSLHLTGYSTVAFEAALFGVPTIFFHKTALDGFKGLLDKKLFFYADNYDDMFNSMERILSRNITNTYKSSYINIDPQTHVLCLEEMLRTSHAMRHKETMQLPQSAEEILL